MLEAPLPGWKLAGSSPHGTLWTQAAFLYFWRVVRGKPQSCGLPTTEEALAHDPVEVAVGDPDHRGRAEDLDAVLWKTLLAITPPLELTSSSA